jgi:hypothetical protein
MTMMMNISIEILHPSWTSLETPSYEVINTPDAQNKPGNTSVNTQKDHKELYLADMY